jgi:hypothetical protein
MRLKREISHVKKQYKTIIISFVPTGLTAALYVARRGQPGAGSGCKAALDPTKYLESEE